MDKPLLNDPSIPPSPEVLRTALGDSYPAYEEMLEAVTGDEFGLLPEWRYYKDGKAWLCKMTFRKKTVFWLSAWDGHFKTSFYIVERHCRGIHDLEIDDNIKEGLKKASPSGTLFPVTMSISRKEQVKDLLTLVVYKKGLKV